MNAERLGHAPQRLPSLEPPPDRHHIDSALGSAELFPHCPGLGDASSNPVTQQLPLELSDGDPSHTLRRSLRQVPPEVAREVGEDMAELMADREALAGRIAEAERQAGAVTNVEQAANTIVATAYRLEDVQGGHALGDP